MLHDCDAEHLARLLEDHPDRLPHLEALAHRAARLEERLRLAAAPLALLEQPRVLDRDARLIGERLQQGLVARGERARRPARTPRSRR